MDITIERSLDIQLVERIGYTVLDAVSDIGGIQGIMLSLTWGVLSFLNYRNIENFMVSKLYRFHESRNSGNSPN